MPESKDYDPVYIHSRRESLVIVCAWVVFCLWVVGYSALNGYDVNHETMKTVLGMPSWVFWGVALPWLCANIVIYWFSFVFMADDPLEPGEDNGIPSGEKEDRVKEEGGRHE